MAIFLSVPSVSAHFNAHSHTITAAAAATACFTMAFIWFPGLYLSPSPRLLSSRHRIRCYILSKALFFAVRQQLMYACVYLYSKEWFLCLYCICSGTGIQCGAGLRSSDKRAVMSTLGAVKEAPGRVDILQHCLFTLTTEFRHHLANEPVMTNRLLGWSPLLPWLGTALSTDLKSYFGWQQLMVLVKS